ncbi:MAG TPA: GNAT family N-acetyltransferase [Clostridiales bacterium]|nr:GNAT family N-acetyltransferase [Clostridiales bacterium]HQP69699.1 GNAT family N-acetyltransferase [Clostridiales bacterium]
MTEFKLVEYSPKYAKAIADMWNASKDGWNGESDHKTEEGVLRKEAISSHLNLYLALDGEKVIGYCKLSKYFAEENTLYVDLLNVDPAYHGKKAGKMLVKKSVERTIELGYPRIDLFTWAGNTKAVPMYKKCGFFWEQMEGGSTHLMNFIPTVVQAELFRDFFKKADWYDDSNRKIDLIPDGVSENGFDYLTYSWQYDGNNLLVEFEKTGRGIRRIETDDYSITSSVIKNKLVFGKDYTISYEIVNKTGKKLEVGIKGLTDKNIKTQADFNGNVKGKKNVEAKFNLDKIEIDQSIWQTHPCVMSEISVNGKKVIFKTGINPQFPLKLKANGNFTLVHAGIEKELYLDVENNFDEECKFTIKLPKVPEIEFSKYNNTFSLKKGERNTVVIKTVPRGSVLISKDIEITAKFKDRSKYSYKQKFELAWNTYDGKVYGETSKSYYMSLGKYCVRIDKDVDFNEMVFWESLSDTYGYNSAPKIGKPYSSEFVRKAPYKTEFIGSDNATHLKAFFRSEDFPGCEFSNNYKLNQSGMLEQWFEIISFPKGFEEIYVTCDLNFRRHKVIVPYNGKLHKYDQNAYGDTALDFLNNEKISENWMFAQDDKHSIALIWPENFKMNLCSWFLSAEHKFTRGGKTKSDPVIFAIDVFETVKDVREFALKKHFEQQRTYDSFDLEINAGNPFSDKKVSGSFIDHKDKPIDATVKISSVNDTALTKVHKAVTEDKVHKVDFGFKFKGKDPIEIITANADYYSRELKKTKAVFICGKGSVKTEKVKEGENTVFKADNGILKIKSSPEFAPAVFSLTFKGREWLASDYPERTNKSWWNSWFGGIQSRPGGLKEHHIIAEKTLSSFVNKTDSLGNKWEGIELVTAIKKFDGMKGLTIRQFFLMKPEIPVLALYTDISNKTGYYKDYHQMSGAIYINPDDDLKNIIANMADKGRENMLKCGYEAVDSSINSNLISFTNKIRKEHLHYYNADPVSRCWFYSDNAVIMNNFNEGRKIKNGETKVFPPKFIIFSDIELTEENLIDLQNVRFEK